jgi:GNAT superfamily N-acetyltransferase
MERFRGEFRITDSKDEMNMGFIISSLHTTYWAEGRQDEIIRNSFGNSTVLSLFNGKDQLGFARLVGDACTFCWLCDVFVDPLVQGEGLGKFLMESVMAHPMTQVRLKLLLTKDAHGLYEQYGFERCEAMSLRSDSY